MPRLEGAGNSQGDWGNERGVRDTEGRPPGGQIRRIVTAEMPRLSLLRVANHALRGASDESKRTKLARKKNEGE